MTREGYKEELKLKVKLLRSQIDSDDLRPEDIKMHRVLLKHWKEELDNLNEE